MLEHLNSPYRRRLFFVVSLLMIALLAGLQFLALPRLFDLPSPPLPVILGQVFSNMLSAAVASVATMAALLFFSPPPEPESGTTIVRPHDRSRVIEQTRHDADRWWFSGGLGRYTRASTLPELAEHARRNNKTIEVALHLLDLHDTATCEAYAEYRRSAWSAKYDTKWTLRRVQLELAATLVAAAVYGYASPRLNVSVRWRPAMSVFRIDLGDRGAMMTQEDTRQEAIFFGRASGGYAGFREQLRVDDQFLRPAKMPRIDAAVDELTDSTLKSAIPGSDLEQLQLTDPELRTIVDWLRSRKHPYS